jgi:myo-inositol 2-dehydrogenase / D-chiro-inositol 1-dehydrogenase
MTVRVGVIGVGSIGTAHATSLAREISGATVSVVHDFDAAQAAALATDIGARSVAAPTDVFEADDVDAVLIASPDAVHAEQLMLGLKAGKPILCEKPLATSESEAKAVLDAKVALGRRIIQVGFMRRFDPGYAQLKSEFTVDRIGDPRLLQAGITHDRALQHLQDRCVRVERTDHHRSHPGGDASVGGGAPVHDAGQAGRLM